MELRRCLDYVSQHAHVLESVLRGAGAPGADAPLSASLVRQAAALQRCMAQCVANASRIRTLLTATHQPQMDTMLAKMVSRFTLFLLYRVMNSPRKLQGTVKISAISDTQNANTGDMVIQIFVT